MSTRRPLLLAQALLLVLAAAPAAFSSEAGSDLDLALAGVVDTRLWPEEAAALETRPSRMLLDKVRAGPDEAAMSWYVVKRSLTAEKLLRSADDYRGSLTGVPISTVVELRRVEAPGVGRFDRYEVYAGIVGRLQRNPDSGAEWIDLRAFRALRLPGEPMLYPGDKVNLSGYFLKNVPVVDATGGVHWMPLLVCPWPTFRKWLPLGPQLEAARMTDLLPTSEIAHEEVRSRLVLDVREDGRLALDGAPVTRAEALAELRRYAFAHPGRAIVARLGGSGSEALARALKEESGVKRMLPKGLPASGGDGGTRSDGDTRTLPEDRNHRSTQMNADDFPYPR